VKFLLNIIDVILLPVRSKSVALLAISFFKVA